MRPRSKVSVREFQPCSSVSVPVWPPKASSCRMSERVKERSRPLRSGSESVGASPAISGSPIAYEIHIAELADGRRVVLRRWHRPREPERAAFLEARGAFLDANGVAAPRLLATTAHAGLYEFAPGALLGDTTGRSCR